MKLPETASANDIYNSFSPSIIKGGLHNSKEGNKNEVSVMGKIAAGTKWVEALMDKGWEKIWEDLPDEFTFNFPKMFRFWSYLIQNRSNPVLFLWGQTRSYQGLCRVYDEDKTKASTLGRAERPTLVY